MVSRHPSLSPKEQAGAIFFENSVTSAVLRGVRWRAFRHAAELWRGPRYLTIRGSIEPHWGEQDGNMGRICRFAGPEIQGFLRVSFRSRGLIT